MRGLTQNPVLVGAAAGLLIALLYLLVRGPSLDCLILLVVVALCLVAGGVAAAGTPPAPLIPAPAAPGAPAPAVPTPRSRQVRAAAIAGAVAGLGFGLAGLIRVLPQILDPALGSQLDQLLAQGGAPGGGGGTILTVGSLCAGAIVLVLFPAVFASLGALAGYVWTALRPATRPAGGA